MSKATPGDEWERVGRDAVAGEVFESRQAASDALTDIERALYAGDGIDGDDVREARLALNRAHRALEELVVPISDGAEPWGDPLPDVPYERLRDECGCDEPGQGKTDE